MDDLKQRDSRELFSPDRRKIIDELHSYSRHNMQLWVQWFTFFVTINYVALGWFAGQLSRSELTDRKPLLYVATVFMVQGILGVWVSLVWRHRLLRLGLQTVAAYDKLLAEIPFVEFPHAAYGYAIALGSIALVALIGVWLALIVM